MKEARKVFETILKANGHTNFEIKNNKYIAPAMQTRWKYFLMGWQMKGLS